MNIVNAGPCEFAWVVGQGSATLILKWGGVPRGDDFVPGKPRTDVIVTGAPVPIAVRVGARIVIASRLGPVPVAERKASGRFDGPRLPKDFDWSFFQAAPREQQLEGFLSGDEEVRIGDWTTRLPGLRVPVRVDGVEVPMRLDTLCADATAKKLALTWRGSVELASDRFDARIVVGEPNPAPEEDRPERPSVEPYRVAAENFAGASLAGRDFSRAILEGACFRDADLTGTKFERAHLAGADFRGARLEGARFDRADLTDALAAGATFHRAPEAIFATADLRGCSFGLAEGADFSGSALRGADLRGANLAGACLEYVSAPRIRAEGADLSGVRASNGLFDFADFRRTRAAGSIWQEARAECSDWTDADLPGAEFEGARLAGAVLTGADLRHARMPRASLRGAVARRADFFRVDLEHADCEGADFEGSNLYGVAR